MNILGAFFVLLFLYPLRAERQRQNIAKQKTSFELVCKTLLIRHYDKPGRWSSDIDLLCKCSAIFCFLDADERIEAWALLVYLEKKGKRWNSRVWTSGESTVFLTRQSMHITIIQVSTDVCKNTETLNWIVINFPLPEQLSHTVLIESSLSLELNLAGNNINHKTRHIFEYCTLVGYSRSPGKPYCAIIYKETRNLRSDFEESLFTTYKHYNPSEKAQIRETL